jgi:hypothetical protein
MNKNLRNKLVAASIGAALVLAPTAAFAKTTLTPSLALSPAKAKMGSVDHAADKVARTAYRAALKVWQDTRNKAQVDYKASILAYRAAIKTNKESRKQIEVTFNVAVNAAKVAYEAATTGTVTAAARQAALNARVAAVAAATNVRAAAIIALPTLPIKLPAPTVAPKPVSPGAPVKP